MRLFRISNLLYAAATACLAALLFWTSQNVQHAENKLDDVKAKLHAEQDSLHVLEAEWSYLTRPERLEQLAKDNLHMVPAGAEGLLDDPQAVPVREKPALPGLKPAYLHAAKSTVKPKPAAHKKEEKAPAVNDRARFDSLIGSLSEDGGSR